MTAPGHRRSARVEAWWHLPLVVAVGGAAGSLCRYGLSVAVGDPTPDTALTGTFITNISGCLFIGLLTAVLAGLYPGARYLSPLLITGFLGGYTTFSHYMSQLRQLISEHSWGTAVGYGIGSILLGWIAVWAGLAAGHALTKAIKR